MQKPIEWSHEKNLWLKQNRGICFEDIVGALETGNIVAAIAHPSKRYEHQGMYVVQIGGYIYAVPYVEDGTKIFLKTIFPSRKYTKQFIAKDSI
ncbi:MAG: toxin [Patescibacteria group bacterium]